MDCEITQFVIKNENAQNEAQQRISMVTADVIDEFASGNMDQSDVAREIQRRVGLLFIRSVVSDSLQPQGLQHTRLPYPSPIPGACSNSCPSSQ